MAALILFLLALLGWLPTAGGALPDDRRDDIELLKRDDFGSHREFLAYKVRTFPLLNNGQTLEAAAAALDKHGTASTKAMGIAWDRMVQRRTRSRPGRPRSSQAERDSWARPPRTRQVNRSPHSTDDEGSGGTLGSESERSAGDEDYESDFVVDDDDKSDSSEDMCEQGHGSNVGPLLEHVG